MCEEGGILYSYFTPVWSASNGHHWSYFESGLPAYIHLNLTHMEFIEWCNTELGLSSEEVEIHAHQIYKSTRINRLTPKEWNKIFTDTSFNILALNEIGQRNIRI